MQVTVVGYQKLDYFSKKKDRQIQGVALKCLCDSRDENFVGTDVKEVFVSKDIVDEMGFVPAVGSDIELFYDFDGRFSYLIGYKLLNQASDNEF